MANEQLCEHDGETAAAVKAEVRQALSDRWVYSYRSNCVERQMRAIEPIIDRLLAGCAESI